VTLTQGESVTWNNVSGTHNVHFDDNSFDEPPSPLSGPWSRSRQFVDVGTFNYYCDLHGGPGGVGMSGSVTVTAFAYPRPGGATPLRVPLLPAFSQCTTATQNSNHVAPLNLDSCNPAGQESALLTTSSIGQGQGSATLAVVAGNPGTPADEADVNVLSSATNVVRKSDATAYSGKAILAATIRITDRANGPAANGSATVRDTELSLPVDCVGGTCNMNTTLDTLVPDLVKEQKRTIIESFTIVVKDAGPDASIGSPSCAPNCGTGDEQVFLRQGAFAP
jgi:hypothetical protein